MKLTKLLHIFKAREEKESGSFSTFFLNASEEQKKKVLREAAQGANKEQRKILSRSELKARAE